MFSINWLQPSAGIRHSAFSFSMSEAPPDHPIAATMLPPVRSSVYSLPVNFLICPESAAALSCRSR